MEPEKQTRFDLSFDGAAYAASVYALAGSADSQVAELRRIVGDSIIDRVLKFDPQPMIMKAVDILDEGDMKNGLRTWIWGRWGFYLTQTTLQTKLAPVLKLAPGYRGHMSSGDHQDAVLRTLWCDLDSSTGKLTAIVHVLPRDMNLRAAIAEAVEMGTVEREYRLSLAPRELTFDKTDSNMIIGFGDVHQQKEMSLDLVRYTGTKAARMKTAMMLNADDTDNKDTVRGGRAMEFAFKSLDELRNSDVVQMVVDQEVNKKLNTLSADQQMKVLSGVPVETLLKHEAVKPFATRQTREEVLKSLSADELKGALSANTELMRAATEQVEAQVKNLNELEEKCLTHLKETMKLSEADANKLWLMNGATICSLKDPIAECDRLGKLFVGALSGDAAPNATGVTTKAEQKPGKAENFEDGVKRLKALRGF